ncbi:unnamed protein product [Microthlaspi erraticum]|uniref:Helitron helicase-like domain-containing protein n=1 Tax=Microthlaspi erraticum TaxID=1685480 RepID=A0A6D2IU23_9BRAS|nr:unnamed protein product [Microthlaspi erraticum]
MNDSGTRKRKIQNTVEERIIPKPGRESSSRSCITLDTVFTRILGHLGHIPLSRSHLHSEPIPTNGNQYETPKGQALCSPNSSASVKRKYMSTVKENSNPNIATFQSPESCVTPLSQAISRKAGVRKRMHQQESPIIPRSLDYTPTPTRIRKQIEKGPKTRDPGKKQRTDKIAKGVDNVLQDITNLNYTTRSSSVDNGVPMETPIHDIFVEEENTNQQDVSYPVEEYDEGDIRHILECSSGESTDDEENPKVITINEPVHHHGPYGPKTVENDNLEAVSTITNSRRKSVGRNTRSNLPIYKKRKKANTEEKDKIVYNDEGDMNYKCQYCNAKFWYGERLNRKRRTKNPTFSLCCSQGQVKLPPLKEPPEAIKKLIYGSDPLSRHFQKNMRPYNMSFSLTSLGGKVDRSVKKGKGPQMFQLHGENYHLIGSMVPEPGQDPKFYQMYIVDMENELENRLTFLR